VTHRESVPRDRHAHHDLRRIASAVLAVTTLSGGGIGLFPRSLTALDLPLLVAAIFIVDFEVQRGGS
jgi:hypothetical protein